jgi:hypothetical protein
MNVYDVSWSGSSSSGKADNQKKLKNEVKNVRNNFSVRKPQNQGLIGQPWNKKSSSNSPQKAYNNQGKRQRKEAEKQRQEAEKKGRKQRNRGMVQRKWRTRLAKTNLQVPLRRRTKSQNTSRILKPRPKSFKKNQTLDNIIKSVSKKSFPVKKSNEPDVSDQGSELLYDSWVSLKGSSLHLYIQSQLVRIIVRKNLSVSQHAC